MIHFTEPLHSLFFCTRASLEYWPLALDSKYHNATPSISLATALGATPQEEVGGSPPERTHCKRGMRVCAQAASVSKCV